MSDKPEIQIHEYLDISNTLRHYGNMQFAQLSICMAFSGGGAALLFNKEVLFVYWVRIVVELGLVAVALMFLLMSTRVSDYWNCRVNRIKEIEANLGFAQYKVTPPLRFVQNRLAVAFVYWTMIFLFVCFAVKDFLVYYVSVFCSS